MTQNAVFESFQIRFREEKKPKNFFGKRILLLAFEKLDVCVLNMINQLCPLVTLHVPYIAVTYFSCFYVTYIGLICCDIVFFNSFVFCGALFTCFSTCVFCFLFVAEIWVL